MPGSPDDAAARLRAGEIYQDIYHKRAGDRDGQQAVLPMASLEYGRIEHGQLRFASLDARDQAFADGVFFLRIPAGLPIAVGDRVAEQFYAGPAAGGYGTLRSLTADRFGDPLLGFHQRVDQIEQFLLERRFWERDFPPEVAELGNQLTELAGSVLRSVLDQAGIPGRYWEIATGGCSTGAGSYHLTFNHYRPQHRQIGLSSHKDDGFLTLLRTTSPGLQVSRADGWEEVPIDPECLIVNFGLSMQLLTAYSDRPVAAILHRVARQAADRSSYGHFSSSRCAPNADDGIYQYRKGAGLARLCGSRELIEMNDYEIYQGTIAPEQVSR